MTPPRKRTLGRTGLSVSPIACGGASFGYVHKAAGWDPWSAEGRQTAVATLNHALDRGINYFDTAPLYGKGHSETLFGEVLRHRRSECVVASKVWFEETRQGAIDSVQASLERLQTDRIDVVQIHGRMYSDADYRHVTGEDGPLAGLRALKEQGRIGFIGLTTEEPWTAIPFLQHAEIDVYQIAYNLIYQAAARHFLLDAAKAGVGVVTMRTMTSGIFQREAGLLAPGWQGANDLYEACLKFVLSDSRIHSGLISMRFPSEVDRNLDLIANWEPETDFAAMPRLTFEVYKAEDAEAS